MVDTSPHRVRSVNWLLDELQDPFVLFPLQSITSYFSQAATDSLESFDERAGPHGRSRKFWDVPMELHHEEIGLSIGAFFVLGQATLTQTISIIHQLRNVTGNHDLFPQKKRAILELEAERDPRSNLSYLVIVDTAANYFKHRFEWGDNWEKKEAKGVEAVTISDALSLGFVGQEVTENMYAALHGLGITSHDVGRIVSMIQEWRERLGARFSSALGVSTFWNQE